VHPSIAAWIRAVSGLDDAGVLSRLSTEPLMGASVAGTEAHKEEAEGNAGSLTVPHCVITDAADTGPLKSIVAHSVHAAAGL